MSKANPKKAVAAVLPAPAETLERLVVRPMTLAMYAALERIESPLVTGREPRDAAELLPSLYLLTHGADQVFAGNLFAIAFAWADTVPVSALDSVREACERQMKCVLDVMPEAQKKRQGDDGWIASALHFAAREYGWGYREILHEVPLATLMLLRRQTCLDRIMPLSAIERIDEEDGQQEA